MRRSGVGRSAATVPRGGSTETCGKQTFSGRLDSDNESVRDRFATDLPQIDVGREPVPLPRRPFRPPPAKSITCLVRLSTCLDARPVCPEASPLRLEHERRRELPCVSLVGERVSLRDRPHPAPLRAIAEKLPEAVAATRRHPSALTGD